MSNSSPSSVEDIIVEILRIPRAEITDDLDMEATSAWDSLSHMQIIGAIEDEYAIELSADDIVSMRSVAQIKDVLRRHAVNV